MGDNVDYGSIQTPQPTPTSPAEGNLTLTPPPFPQGYILGGLAGPWFLPFLPSWYVPGEARKQSYFFSSCGICQEITATGTSASFQRPLSFSEHYYTDPRMPAQRNVPTLSPHHLWDSASAQQCEFRGFLILCTEWTLLQHGVLHEEAQPGRGHVPRLTMLPRGTEGN